MTDINFNFTPEQEVEFNKILKATKKEYPKFFKDAVEEYRIRILIATNIIKGDDEFGKLFSKNEEQVIIEDKIEQVIIEDK